MMAKNIAIVGVLLTIIQYSTIYAQTAPTTEATDTASFKRFYTGVQLGTGNASAHTFMAKPIRDNGHSLFTGMLVTNIDVGFALTKNLVLISGFQSQIHSLQFDVSGETHRFSGARHQVPLGIRTYLQDASPFGNLPMQVFIDFSAYYAFNSDGTLSAEEAEVSIESPFNGFGSMAGIGMLFFENNRSGVTIAYNVFTDLSGSHARVAGGILRWVYNQIFEFN